MTFADSRGHWLGLCDGSRGDPASLHGALWVPRYNGFETFFALFLRYLLDHFGIGLGIVQGIVELLSLSMEPRGFLSLTMETSPLGPLDANHFAVIDHRVIGEKLV